ncbi:DUF1566 domain-containing protein [Flavobacteriales bacterium]|nr:DUF1566 domain-containing protein [Flavobacteriales bacterium]
MKKIILLFTLLSCTFYSFSQNRGISYQAVAIDENGQQIPGYDTDGSAITNSDISVRFGIYDDNEQLEYEETHQTQTDAFGLFTLIIGNGEQTSSNTFDDIVWSQEKKFLQVEIDIKGGSDFKLMSYQELLSVPFAKYAETSLNPGPQGVSITNTIVNTNGDLILTLSDGSEINAGNVMGETGEPGEDGQDGVDGIDGNDGADGADGIDGQNGISIDTTYVIGNMPYDLVIQYSNGDNDTLDDVFIQGSTGSPGQYGLSIDTTYVIGNMPYDLVIQYSNGDNDTLDDVFIQGSTGSPGQDGVSIDTTYVIGNMPYDLVIQYSNGDNDTLNNVFIPGPIGPQGSTGSPGQDGVDGQNGSDGIDGQNGVSIDTTYVIGNIPYDLVIQYSNGDNDTLDDVFMPGPIGPQGIPGDSISYDSLAIILSNDSIFISNVGSTGGTGPQGPPGPAGQDGVDGIDGNDGAPGATGPPGADGQDGVDGQDGAVGPPGPAGSNGAQGPAGQDGIDGIDALVDYDSLANIISVDSTFITNVGGGMGGGGCEYKYPDGFENITTIHITLQAGSYYIVPNGKNLYLSVFDYLHINNSQLYTYSHTEHSHGLIIGEGDSIKAVITTECHGFLIDAKINPFYLESYNYPNVQLTVPQEEILVILGSANGGEINGIGLPNGAAGAISNPTNNPIICKAGDTITPWNGGYIYGYLVDENYFAGCGGGGGSSSTSINYDSLANIISMDSTFVTNVSGGMGGGCDYSFPEGFDGVGISEEVWDTNPYEVPSGKRLYITNAVVDAGWNLTLVGLGAGQITYPTQPLSQPIIINAGEKVATSSGAHARINGYLVDENYFAGCGGGGSSSTTINYDSLANIISMDSTFLTNVGSGMGGDCNFKFPDGLHGEPITVDLSNYGSFSSIPSGKNLYITNLFSQGSFSIKINNIQVTADNMNSNHTGDAITLHNPLILESGDNISNSNGSGSCGFHGFLIDAQIDPITIDLSSPSTIFSSVPVGKRLYITNLHTTATFGIYINNIRISDAVFMNLGNSAQNSIVLQNPIILTNGESISTNSSSSNETASFNGYLVDENYFAGCGGGGSSSSTSSLDSTTIANMIAASAQTLTISGDTLFISSGNYIVLPAAPLEIGDTYQGGVIFYLDGIGGGLMAALSDQPNAEWGCQGVAISGADGFGIGTGSQNTIDILNGCSTPGIAAYICDTLTLGGHTDWFLPSKEELELMYINLHSQALGIGNFSDDYYWSSTEDDPIEAWGLYFLDGTWNQNVSKNNTYRVRAIRVF